MPKDPREALVEEGQKRQAEAVAAADKMSEATPTPSQLENDRAKLGIEQELEEDGSEPDPNALAQSAQPAEGGEAAKNEQPRRGPGRPPGSGARVSGGNE